VRSRGPFAWQTNNTTREFEYPWVYFTIESFGKKLDIVEIGGGLSGMQFVLAVAGHRVTNVDPGLAATGKGWALDSEKHARLQQVYSAPVSLIPKPIQDAGLPNESADVVYCVSALEHFSETDLIQAAEHTGRVLKVGGHAVFTTDLFLDTEPFCRRDSNKYGRNIDIAALLNRSTLSLVAGNRNELLGFPEFAPDQILQRLHEFNVGNGYPCLAQCFVAKKVAR
jgi:hypothetical protein